MTSLLGGEYFVDLLEYIKLVFAIDYFDDKFPFLKEAQLNKWKFKVIKRSDFYAEYLLEDEEHHIVINKFCWLRLYSLCNFSWFGNEPNDFRIKRILEENADLVKSLFYLISSSTNKSLNSYSQIVLEKFKPANFATSPIYFYQEFKHRPHSAISAVIGLYWVVFHEAAHALAQHQKIKKSPELILNKSNLFNSMNDLKCTMEDQADEIATLRIVNLIFSIPPKALTRELIISIGIGIGWTLLLMEPTEVAHEPLSPKDKHDPFWVRMKLIEDNFHLYFETRLLQEYPKHFDLIQTPLSEISSADWEDIKNNPIPDIYKDVPFYFNIGLATPLCNGRDLREVLLEQNFSDVNMDSRFLELVNEWDALHIFWFDYGEAIVQKRKKGIDELYEKVPPDVRMINGFPFSREAQGWENVLIKRAFEHQ